MKKFDSINVIPFIDIILVLLAIVLITANFIDSNKIKVTLPNSNQKSVASSKKRTFQEITLDQNSIIYFNNKKISIAKLDQKLNSIKHSTTIILQIDKAVIFQKFIEVTDLLDKHKLEKIQISTNTNK